MLPTLLTYLKRIPLADVRYLDSTGSTNDDALNWAEKGAKDFSLVVANTQTKGRGRLDRTWLTNPDSALAFSLVVIPEPGQEAFTSHFTALPALALIKVLSQFNVSAQIKWPNDVIISGRKVAGILLESLWNGDSVHAIIIGIGINVKSESVPPEEMLRFPAACLEDFLSEPVDRWKLLAGVLQEIYDLRSSIGKNQFIHLWDQHLAFKNEMVSLQTPKETINHVRLIGISNDGSLNIQLSSGEMKLISVGEISAKKANRGGT